MGDKPSDRKAFKRAFDEKARKLVVKRTRLEELRNAVHRGQQNDSDQDQDSSDNEDSPPSDNSDSPQSDNSNNPQSDNIDDSPPSDNSDDSPPSDTSDDSSPSGNDGPPSDNDDGPPSDNDDGPPSDNDDGPPSDNDDGPPSDNGASDSSASEFNGANDSGTDIESESEASSEDDNGPLVFGNNEELGEHIKNQLRQWALDGGVMSMRKLDKLLRRLHRPFPNVPLSYKSLLNTPINVEVVDLNGLKMWYKGIQANLSTLPLDEYVNIHNSIIIDIGADGLPLFKRSQLKFWVVLGRLAHTKNKPFIIAIIFGGRDPTTQELCNLLANEVQVLENTGFKYRDVYIEFKIRHYICDAPARAKMKCIIEHGGYYACEKCVVVGEYIDDRMTYINIEAELRTDESFRLRRNPRHHTGESPMERTNWRPVSQFRLDTLHLVYLGVYKRLITAWMKWNGVWKLPLNTKRAISNDLIALVPSCPSDFNRKPRPLTELRFYTAKEYRRSLLYEGVVVFQNHAVDINVYRHFLLLHCAMFILNSPAWYEEKNHIADQALRLFISHSVNIYGRKFVVYNVHNLAHLSAECLAHGPSDSFSSFKFEDRLGAIKRSLKCGYKPLKQAANRDLERPVSSVELDRKDYLIKLARRHYPQQEILEGLSYKYLSINDVEFCCNNRDSCFQTITKDVVILSNIVLQGNDVYFVGCSFQLLENLYDYPIASSELSIFSVSELDEQKRVFPLQEIYCKCWLMPNGDTFACFPLLHTIGFLE